MKETRIMMGMPITVEVIPSASAHENSAKEIIDSVFDYFGHVDLTFSTYKDASEIMKINRGELKVEDASDEVREIFALAEQTKIETDGYFDIVNRKGIMDPSGIVKGWAIRNAANMIGRAGFENYYVNAGGDIQAHGLNSENKPWSVGITNPFNTREIVKVIYPGERGVATSGTYERGSHIYNPKDMSDTLSEIVSLTVVGPDVYEADRFATAAFAMGRRGIEFIRRLDGFDCYVIDSAGIGTMTEGLALATSD